MKKVRVFKIEKLKMFDVSENKSNEYEYIGQCLEIYKKGNNVYLKPFTDKGADILNSMDCIVEDYYGNEWKMVDGKPQQINKIKD